MRATQTTHKCNVMTAMFACIVYLHGLPSLTPLASLPVSRLRNHGCSPPTQKDRLRSGGVLSPQALCCGQEEDRRCVPTAPGLCERDLGLCRRWEARSVLSASVRQLSQCVWWQWRLLCLFNRNMWEQSSGENRQWGSEAGDPGVRWQTCDH